MQLSELITTYKENQQKEITCPSDVYEVLSEIKRYHKEAFVVLHLDTKKKIISKEIVSIGILNACLIHPREIFRAAILNNAHSIILTHNHPSGDPSPSDEDIKITTELKRAGEILKIQLLDHVIIGKEGYYSFQEQKRFEVKT